MRIFRHFVAIGQHLKGATRVFLSLVSGFALFTPDLSEYVTHFGLSFYV
jgi:hypothetical protein